MTNVYYFLYRIYKTKDIGYLGNAKQTGALRKETFKKVQPQMAVVIHRQDFKDCAFASAHHLPRYDIGVMLAFRNDNLIARLDEGLAETECHEVDGGRRPGGKHDLFPALRVQEIPYRVAGGFILFSGLGGHTVDSTVKVGVAVLRETRPFVNYRDGTLDGRRVIEIDKRLAVHRSGQGRELLSELFYIHNQSI